MRLIELLFVRELPVSPEVLWPHVTDAAHISAWAGVQITPLTPGAGGHPDGVGATRQVSMGAMTMAERVVEAAPPERFVYQVYEGGMLQWHEGVIVLEPVGEGTRLSWHVALTPAVPGTGWIMRRVLTRQFEAGLDALAAGL